MVSDFENILLLVTPISLLAVIISGLIIGVFYDGPLRLTSMSLYHRFVSGMAFIFTVGISRSIESDIWERWIGIGLLYLIHILATYFGREFLSGKVPWKPKHLE